MHIIDLRAAPEFFPTVADRIWQAWWRPAGVALEHIEARLSESLQSDGFPFTLVALDAGTFAGTATSITDDLEQRPQYSPWIAALWVEPAYRKTGVATALVDQSAKTLWAQGHRTIYLCAKPALRPFYQRLGWRQIEQDAGPDGLDVFERVAA